MKRILATLVAALLILPLVAGSLLAQEGYRVRAGDTLRIEVLQDPALNRSVLVAPDGSVAFPLAGAVAAAGRTLQQVQDDLAARLAPNFAAAPTVFVALEQVVVPQVGVIAPERTIVIYAMGEVANPGRLDIKRGSTLLQALAQMGGFTKFAATKRVQLRRGAKTHSLNYLSIERGTSNAGATVLQEGDVILVPQRRLFE